MDHDVQEAPYDGAEDAAEDDRRRYVATPRLTRDTLDASDVG
jgi:hypothetical protein